MATQLKRKPFTAHRLRLVVLAASALCGSLALAIPNALVQSTSASAFFFVFAVAWWYERGDRDALVSILGFVGAGLLLGAVPFEPVRGFADGLVTCGIVVLVVALLRSRVLSRSAEQARRRLAPARLTGRLRLRVAALDPHTWERIASVVVALAGAAAIVLGVVAARDSYGWRMAGTSDGAVVWNAAFFAAPLHRDGANLRDGSVQTSTNAAPRVGIADSPALTALKLALPGRWAGPELVNMLSVVDLAALLACAAWLLTSLTGSRGAGAVAALVAIVAVPSLEQAAVSGPFDLWPAIAVGAAAMRWKTPLLIAGAAAIPFLNVATGYELAVLVAGLAVMRRLPAGDALRLGVTGFAAAVAAAAASRLLAPDATTSMLWWSSNELARVARATGLTWPWPLAAVAVLATLAGWVFAVRGRMSMAGVALATLLAAVFAVPGLLGGVPLLVPARLLELVPLGWPSLRVLDVATLFALVPLAFVVRSYIERDRELAPALRALAAIALAACGFAMIRPHAEHSVIAATPPGAAVAELPIAESGSRASVMYADELLERDARIVQPIPYVGAPAALAPDASPDAAIRALRALPGPAFLVVRRDVYAAPEDRFAQPTVIEAVDYAIPDLTQEPRLSLSTLTENAEVYALR